MKPILDACCGSRMFWFDKSNPNVIFADNRLLKTTLCDGRKLIIEPDEIIDFRNMPYRDNSFKMVVFDPPHLIHAGKNSWLGQKYGILPSEWKPYIKQGFDECMRVLEPYGTLIFKWNEEQIKLREILDTIKFQPLFGNKRSKTHWLVFMKGLEDVND
jgi:23S rRNA G2069 N7-methylase RlmK/C1962 C5-methylase RlmI